MRHWKKKKRADSWVDFLFFFFPIKFNAQWNKCDTEITCSLQGGSFSPAIASCFLAAEADVTTFSNGGGIHLFEEIPFFTVFHELIELR